MRVVDIGASILSVSGFKTLKLGSGRRLYVLMTMATEQNSFLGIESCHVFITGAAGGIGSAVVKEFLGRKSLIELTVNSTEKSMQ